MTLDEVAAIFRHNMRMLVAESAARRERKRNRPASEKAAETEGRTPSAPIVVGAGTIADSSVVGEAGRGHVAATWRSAGLAPLLWRRSAVSEL
jgi:hypothetical protein